MVPVIEIYMVHGKILSIEKTFFIIEKELTGSKNFYPSPYISVCKDLPYENSIIPF